MPNIAYHVLQSSYSFKIMIGGRQWLLGRHVQTQVHCNGPHAEKNDVDIFYGKGLLPTKLYQKIQETCDWSIAARRR